MRRISFFLAVRGKRGEPKETAKKAGISKADSLKPQTHNFDPQHSKPKKQGKDSRKAEARYPTTEPRTQIQK